MTLPKNLSELPEHLLHLIHEMCFIGKDQPVPQFYLRLAQVNQRFKKLFMSDRIWAVLDVHGVQNDISADYLKRKAVMSDDESMFCGQFDFAKWRHPALTLEVFNSLSLSTQASVLTETHAHDYKLREPLHEAIRNPQLVRYAARVTHRLHFATRSLLQDRTFMMSVAGAGGYSTRYASRELRDDKDFVLRCVSANSRALQFCSKRLLEDKRVVLAHFAKWGTCFIYVSEELHDDRDVAMAAIARNGRNFVLCSRRLRADRQVVMAAVALEPFLLRWASEVLQRELGPQLELA